MKNIARKKKISNVLKIADNPRFKKAKTIFLPSTVSPEGRFDSFILGESVYGFQVGDELICRTDFDINKIGDKALVVADTPEGQRVQPMHAAENIIAVVVAFSREVAQ